jgi:hypothetical protein
MGVNIINNEEWLTADSIIADQLTVGGVIIIIGALPSGSIPSGKRMYFQQNTAPIGWTEVPQATLATNNALLIGTNGSPVLNNTTDFSAHIHTMAAHTHTLSAHTHSIDTFHNHNTTNDPAQEVVMPGTFPWNFAGFKKTTNSATLPVDFAGSGSDVTGAMEFVTIQNSSSFNTTTATTFKYFNVILCEKT